ncbi:MAG TPA: ceramidase domain-containing protein [Burkholderiales bacterium]|nr:ceramidase domain-containing protein [Burkholderiales bacterium]
MIFRIEQSPHYHLFADGRAFFGIANAMDTLSNAGFVVAGLVGLWFLCREASASRSRRFVVPEEMRAWWVLFGAVALAGVGSAWYHVAPDDARLFWDRLPMSLVFVSLVSVVVSERIRLTLGLRLLPGLLVTGFGSVAWWRTTGNLLPYALLQYGSLAFILAIVMTRRSRYTHGSHVTGVLALYAAAKAAECLDSPIYALTGIVSGHTLKHLLAAAGVLWLLRMLSLRSPQ